MFEQTVFWDNLYKQDFCVLSHFFGYSGENIAEMASKENGKNRKTKFAQIEQRSLLQHFLQSPRKAIKNIEIAFCFNN